VVLGFQVPASLLAVLLSGASPTRLWTAIALTYAVSGVVYVLVFRFVRWMSASAAAPRALSAAKSTGEGVAA
jgi:hypothetical protein